MDTHVIINLFHILLVAPFLLWVGISRGNLPEGVFIGLIVLGIIVALYHSFKAYTRLVGGSGYAWVNLIHALWIGPLLLFIGAKKREGPRAAYEVLLLTAFGALGYHLYQLASHYDFL